MSNDKAQESAITQIICPHCGHRHDDSDEWGQYIVLVDDGGIDNCGNCGKEILWSRTVTTTYTAEKA